MKRVLFSSPYVPPEFISAHGLRPARLCPPIPRRSDRFLREGMCPYAHSFLTAACADKRAAGAIFTVTCDQMRRTAELFASDSSVSAHLMHVPATWQTPAAQRLYVSELERLGRFLARIGGKRPSKDALTEAMIRHDGMRSELKAAHDGLSARAWAEAALDFFEGKAPRLDNVSRAVPGKAVPLAIVGGPLPRDELWLLDFIERHGGRVALNATETGLLGLSAPFRRGDSSGNPMLELADAYFGAIPGVFQRPNSPLYAWLKRELAAAGARGIILRHYLWCDLWRAEVSRIAQWSDLPVLHLDSAGGDADKGRIASRAQAFVEALR